jgi:hypothetical protein
LEKIKYLCKIPCPPSQRPASVWSKRKRRGRDRRLETREKEPYLFRGRATLGRRRWRRTEKMGRRREMR